MVDSAGKAKPSEAGDVIAAASGMTALVISLFFLWGGATSLNDVLVPKLKGLFQLTYAQT